MKILLIDPHAWQKHSINLGLAYIAASLKISGFSTKILDLNNNTYSDQELKSFLSEYNPQVVGVSVKTATANSASEIIEKLKGMHPDIIYVAGGPHVTLCGKEFMSENEMIDFGLAGESEESFPLLLKIIKSGESDFSSVKGLYYRKNNNLIFNNRGRDLDIERLAFPDFRPIKDANFANFRYPLMTSRGCPYGCIFCCVGLVFGKKWRARKPEDVIGELLEAKARYQISSFEIMDDNFTFDIRRAKQICRLMIKSRLNLEWWCHNGLRADKLDKELLCLMKKAGCRSIAIGIETGDEGIFSNINKGEKLSDIIRAVKMIKKAGMRCVGYFIIGLPGESMESIKKTVRLQRELNLSDFKYNMLVPYPGTVIWDIIHRGGRMLKAVKNIYHFDDKPAISFETQQINQDLIEKCFYLAHNQDWIFGEEDLKKIKSIFRDRFQSHAKRIIVIENRNSFISRFIKLEFSEGDVLRIYFEPVPSKSYRAYKPDKIGKFGFFDELFQKLQSGHELIVDMSKKAFFLKNNIITRTEYIRGEILPDPLEWDGSAKVYFACRLKHGSLATPSEGNGIIYKDNVALPFNPKPQSIEGQCGKIEDGLGFISAAAYNKNSVYTADYLSKKITFDLQKVIIGNNDETVLEKIGNEADILFCPEKFKYIALMTSRAKMNIVYSFAAGKNIPAGYRLAEHSLPGFISAVKKIKALLLHNYSMVANILKQAIIFMKEKFACFNLWVQILFLMIKDRINCFQR